VISVSRFENAINKNPGRFMLIEDWLNHPGGGGVAVQDSRINQLLSIIRRYFCFANFLRAVHLPEEQKGNTEQKMNI
jgi:hypothetical protein